ncbi:MAG: beta-lactamase family protein [Armatimonadetes bacterium]|nr:beta-lactamase family protein [Armatimonadota bacterium]
MEAIQERLPRTMALIRQGMEEGLHIGAQGYVSLNGEAVADFAVGEARLGAPMTTDTLMIWMSSTKPVAAVAIAQLWERRKLELDDRVSRFVPEFGQKGKEPITLRHLLTHTGGFRAPEATWRIAPWDEIIQAISEAPLEPNWIPGRDAGYHVASSWYLLGEIVRRLDGRSFESYVREEIFLPLGMWDSWVGMPPEERRAYGDRIGIMHDTSNGEPEPLPFMSSEEALAVSRPGGNGFGPIRELGRFYEMMLARGECQGHRILAPQTVEALTALHRVGVMDRSFRHVLDWGLGFILNSNPYGVETVPYGYGRHCSLRTFGHSGHQSSSAFADPEYGLAVALVYNGMPGEPKHNRRVREINSAIYEDLELSS